MERTLILLKPDCLADKRVGSVMARFEEAGLQICGAKMLRLSSDVLREHYSHLVERPFYPDIVAFMQSTPVVALILQGPDAVARIREMLGPTDSKKAAKGTIRGDFGTENMRNIAHASDSVANAEVEIKRFFKSEEVFNW